METTLPRHADVGRRLHQSWWLFVLRGVIGVAVGCLALAYPGIALGSLILLLAAFFVVDGVFTIVKAARILRADSTYWSLMASGLLSVLLGVLIFAWPGLSLLTLVFLVAFWAIVTGILEIVAAVRFRKVISGEWLWIVFGLISFAFGAIVLAAPGAGLVYLVLMISFYGFASGFTMFALAFRVRALERRLTAT